MATMLHNLQLFMELTVETEPGRTLPTLLGSHWKANTEPPESWYRARGWRRLGCCMVTMLHIVQLFAELTIETEHTLTLPTLLGSY